MWLIGRKTRSEGGRGLARCVQACSSSNGTKERQAESQGTRLTLGRICLYQVNISATSADQNPLQTNEYAILGVTVSRENPSSPRSRKKARCKCHLTLVMTLKVRRAFLHPNSAYPAGTSSTRAARQIRGCGPAIHRKNPHNHFCEHWRNSTKNCPSFLVRRVKCVCDCACLKRRKTKKSPRRRISHFHGLWATSTIRAPHFHSLAGQEPLLQPDQPAPCTVPPRLLESNRTASHATTKTS
jgi:hypothetical protein